MKIGPKITKLVGGGGGVALIYTPSVNCGFSCMGTKASHNYKDSPLLAADPN